MPRLKILQLRYVQDDRLFFSKLDTKFLVIPKTCPMTVGGALSAVVEQSFTWPLKNLHFSTKNNPSDRRKVLG